MPKRPDLLSLIAEAVEEGTARAKHTRWMTKRHDEFARLVEPEANWTRVTAAFVQAGLVPEGTKSSALKRDWGRVKARVAKKRKGKSMAAGQNAPVIRQSGKSPTPEERPPYVRPQPGGTGGLFQAPSPRPKPGELEALLGPLAKYHR
jgi:hypothetical protein